MENVLADLARTFPLLSTLVEHRAGGHRKVSVGSRRAAEELLPLPLILGDALEEMEPADLTPSTPNSAETGSPPTAPEGERSTPPAPVELPGRAGKGPKRPIRLGLTIQYESRPEDGELGRLVESTVWVNDAHPAYRRAVASRAEGYHLALTVAMALASIAVEPPQQHAFVSAFLTRWGEAVRGAPTSRRLARR
jgi:hypothetical protein